MSKALELKGKKFGRLLVVRHTGVDKHRKHLWECLCDCGNTTIVAGSKLVSGNTKSCKCLTRDKFRAMVTTHGRSGTIEHRMFHASKSRAKKENIPHTLELSDITIPEYCPVLGMKLCLENKKIHQENSPSLDKLIPALGYVKGNIRVISFRANWLKQNASWEELMAVANWLKGETNGAGRESTA
jgi:hypothetical protein